MSDTAAEDRIGLDQERVGSLGPLADERLEGGIDLGLVARAKHLDLQRRACPAACTSFVTSSAPGLLGFTSSATMAALGAIWFSNPRRFAPSAVDSQVTPVMLPSGLARLVTRPVATGSAPLANTIEIVVVAAFAAGADAIPPPATITDTARRTRSPASAGSRS